MGKLRGTISWTPAEDNLLFLLKEQGWHWSAMPDKLPGRTAGACQSRHHMLSAGKYKTQKVPRLGNTLEEIKANLEAAPDLDSSYAAISPDHSSHYVFRVPDGDPYLQRLIAVHGRDNINRDVVLKKVA